MTYDSDLLIIGGGLNGPAMALAAAHAGLSATVIDAQPAAGLLRDDFDGRAYALALSSVRMLRALGLWDELAQHAQPMLEIKVSDGRAGEGPLMPFFLHFDHAEIEEGPMGFMVEDRHLRPALLEALNRNADEDRFLRHAASWALGGIGDVDQLVAAAEHPSPAVRIGALLGLRRMQHPSIAVFLKDADPYVATEAAIAIYDKPIDAALPALADMLGKHPQLPFAYARRALHAANRLGGADRHAAILEYVLNDAGSLDKLRAEAADL